MEIVAVDQPSELAVFGLPYWAADGVATLAAVDAPDAASPDALALRGFEGKSNQVLLTSDQQQTLVAVGLGAADVVTLDAIRRYAAAVVKSTGKATTAAMYLPVLPASISIGSASQAVAEGVRLGMYQFNRHKSKPQDRQLARVEIVGADAGGVDLGVVISEAVIFARDLVNEPPGTMTPPLLADAAAALASRTGVTAEVWGEERIAKEGLGGLLGVAAGSAQPPRLVMFTYDPPDPIATVALVGKGITFDSGGLSIKTGDGMVTMKTDMAGAAAVLAAGSLAPRVAPRVRVIAIAAVAENMPGPAATRPGDVLKARNGKTMEVLNTDAEGRLVLSDALSLAAEKNPDVIIDLATLTGACKFALGNDIAGLMGNDDDLIDSVRSASEDSGELVWPLPLPERYRRLIDSDIADIKNLATPGGGGVITAGLFLKEFVGDIPWAHLDIAGPGRADSDDGYVAKGGSGFGVRLLVSYLQAVDANG